MTMYQLAVVDNRRELDLLERNCIRQGIDYTIEGRIVSDPIADYWQWTLIADCRAPLDEPPAAA